MMSFCTKDSVLILIIFEFCLQGMVEELSSGPCVAMEIVAKDKTLNTAVEFRKLVGPADPVSYIYIIIIYYIVFF